MKTLVFGATGQVGLELARRLTSRDGSRFLSRSDVDLFDPEKAADAIRHEQPDIVVNAAAWTNVDAAEAHEDEAMIINAHAPSAMARTCAALRIPFLHISTDYVFDGQGDHPYFPDDQRVPLNAYGRTKKTGEDTIKQSGANFLILRTSWVFSSHGRNFFKTVLRLAAEKSELSIVADQRGGPTPASALADALVQAAEMMHGGKRGGVYHFSGAPDVSWYEFATFIVSAANLSCKLVPISSIDYPTAARRPSNSCLGCSSFLSDFNIARPDWRAGVVDALKQAAART